MLKKEKKRIVRHKRIRKKMQGSEERPRLTVHRSIKNLNVQVIDDIAQKTLASITTSSKSFASQVGKATKKEQAEKLGGMLGETLKEKGIQKIAFDRGGYLYHGRIKALAEGLRQTGIQF